MQLLRYIRACIGGCTLLHARTHVLWAWQYLNIVWQVVTQNQTRWLARVVFQVPEIATVLGAPRPSRYGRAVEFELSGEFCHGDRLTVRTLSQPLDCFYGLSDGGRHGRLHALTHQVDYQFPDGCIVLYGGDDTSLSVPFAGGLVQKGVSADEVKQRTEVSPQPDRHRGYKIGKYLRVGDRDAMLSALKPNLEGMPSCEVRGSFIRFVGQNRHDRTRLLLRVCDGKGEQASLVLRMELDGGGGHDEVRLHAF